MTFKTWINDLRDVQSVINNISNTRVIIDGSTGLLNTNSLKEMSSAVSGLSKEQALLVLSTKNLNAAQQEQVLLAAGIISSENSITASAISQALAKTQLSATEKEALLTKLGLIDATTGEAIANATCTKEELLKALATKGIIGADADAIISSIGLTSANSAQAVSFDLLTVSIWANIKALGKWLITNPVGWAILGGTAIFGLVKAYDALTDSVEEVKERTENLLESYNSAISEANSNAKTIESLADRYETLSKGVNNLGENVSLTSDEYSEYNDIVNQIADMFPNLITGYTDEGNAILSLKGNVEKLRDAYKEAQTEAYNLLIVSGEDSDGNDIISNYKNQINGKEPSLSKTSSYINGEGGAKDAIDIITRLTGTLTPDEFRDTYNELYEQYKNIWNSDKIQDALKSSGFEELSHAPKWGELTSDDLAKVKSTAQATIQTYKAEIDSQLKNVDTLANAYLMTNEDYSKLDEQSQTAASLIVNSITEDIANGFETKEDVGTYVANIVSKIKDNPDLNKSLVDLFTEDFSSMSVDEAKSKLDGYINTIAKVLNEDPVELKIRLGFDDYDDVKPLKTKVQGFLKDEFDDKIGELSLDDLQVASKLEIPEDTLLSWDELKQKIEETKNAASEETPISFTDALNSSEYADIKEKLLDLAKSGEITAETLSSTEEYNALLEKVGISAESAKDQILDMLSAQERLAGAAQGLSKLKSAYEEFKNKDIGFVTAETLESLPDVFKNLPDFDLFSKIVGNPESGKEKIQQAFNDIVKSYLSDQETLQGLVNADSATIQTYIANLKQMGITNAEEVVRTANEALNSDNKMIDAAEKEYNKYLKGKLKGGEKFLESTASNNSKLKNALGSTYKSDYDNWCDLLSKKADAYNEFVKAIGGSYDDSKNVAQNLAANNGAFGANEYAEAQAAYDKWKQTKKQADDLKNSLKLDYSQITTDFGANWSPTTSSDKSKKSKSKTKSDAAEVFDFIEIKLNNLADKASKAKDKIDDLLTFGQKKNQTKKAIEATTKAITAQEKAYKKYMSYADKAAKTQNSKKTTSSSSSTGGNAVYDAATNYLGLKYVFGGASLTKGADCSGFTQQIYKKFGVSLPHHAADQAKMGTKITSKKNLQAGDLVFFGSKNNITHVGIYGGDGKFIESPHTGASVRVSKLSSRKDFVSGSRFSGISGSTTTSGRNVKKVKGVSSKTLEHYKKLIREGTLGSDGIASIKNENLKNALKDYQTYYEKAKACKEQVASLTDQLKDLYETLANNPIDSASDKIEKLGTKMDILNAKVGNLTFNPTKKIGTSDIDSLYKQIIKNYNSQLSASKTAYTGATKSYKSNKSSLTKSLKKTKAKNIGLTQKEFNSIKSNLKSNKSISYNLINKIENGTLREKCIAHNEYLLAKNTATDNYNQAKEDHTSNVRQARKDRFDKVQARYDNKAGLIEQKKNAVSNSLSIAEAKGQLIGDAYYTRQADAVKSDMQLKQEEAEKLAKKLSTIKFGSDEWYEAQEALNGVYESIQQDEQELAEFQKSINELKFDRFDELLNKLGDITDETDFLIDMLDSDNLFDSDTGMITQDGITAMGLTAQNYDTYLTEAEQYKKQIADLNEMYNDGNGTIGYNDYISKLREYQQGQRDSIKSANEAKKSLVAYVKQGLDAQNDALEEAISKKKELLETEKDLKDFQDKIADSNKNIAKLEKQIATLEGDDSEENRKKLQQLKSDLQDAQKDRDDTLYDRSVSDQEKALDDMLTKSKESAEEYLKDTDKVFSDALTYVNVNSSQVASNIEKIAKDTGYDISSYIVNAWEKGGSAVGDYTSTLSSNVPNITAQLSLIASSWQSICDAADRAAEASAKYAETQVGNTQKNNSGSGNTTTSNSGSNNKKVTTNTYINPYEIGISNWIKSKLNPTKHDKSYYGALNQYLYEKSGGKVLSIAEEVELANKLKVSVKKDLSGKDDRKRILNALKTLVPHLSFNEGGIITDLVKLSGEDGVGFLKRGEAVLSKEQTQALLNFKPVIPQIDSIIGNLKNIPVSRSNNVSEPHIEINTTVEGVATDQIVKQMEGVAQKQAENVVRKINQATYTKGVRR